MPSRHPKPLTALLLASILAFLLLLAPIIGFQPAHAEAWDEHIPSTQYNGALVPDWGHITFSTLPVISESGSLQIPDSLAAQLGYNPSRIWSENTPIDQVLMLGDLQDAFGLQTFNLGTIAQLTGLNLNGISLANFPLIAQQTLASLVAAIPQLAQRTLDQVPILKDLVSLNLNNLSPSALSNLALQSLNLSDFGSSPLSELATNGLLGQFSLGDLNLSQYSLTAIPGLAQTPLANLQGWQQTFVGQVPGLSQVPFAAFPNAPTAGYFGFIAIDDVTYGPMEHRSTPTQRSITGSDKVGFNYQCAQSRGCAYLELNSPASLGVAGDPGGLHGAQWIKGGTGQGAQMVPGGHGILGVINGGQEPTGRLPFGPVFKVVLTNTDESSGTVTFGIYFRVCHHGLIDLGCTPYFIGPIPWFSAQEKGIVFVGETPGTPPSDIPDIPPLPAEVQQQIDALIQANKPDSLSAVTVDGPCLAKVMSQVPPSESSAAATTVPKLLEAAQRAGITDRAQLAYILATAETETNFRPRNEDGGYCGEYGPGCYYGRGDVQLTGQSNYQYWSNRLGVDLINHPELANQPDLAATIAVEGMRDGTFTGNRLGQYINGQNHDFVGARHIVNDSDKSDQVAQQADQFLGALNQCATVATTTDTNLTSANHPGQLIARSNGNATEQKIVNAINAHYNESSAGGPGGGNVACAYEVNRVLQDSIGHKIGFNPNLVSSVEADLQSGSGQRIGAQWAHAGDVIVFRGSSDDHIGFCLNDGCSQVLSNSSSQSQFRWVGSRGSYETYYNTQGHIYRVQG
ncbi:hypothetical protein IQ273_10325 [Nodosilinea sp. LEGE 07298]|nr:hypothetical protein [Nodosilinea sp. LEGE 07298]